MNILENLTFPLYINTHCPTTDISVEINVALRRDITIKSEVLVVVYAICPVCNAWELFEVSPCEVKVGRSKIPLNRQGNPGLLVFKIPNAVHMYSDINFKCPVCGLWSSVYGHWTVETTCDNCGTEMLNACSAAEYDVIARDDRLLYHRVQGTKQNV